MESYIIEGGNRLEGTVNISGSKNASLPIIAGTILSGKTTKLYNVPDIPDELALMQECADRLGVSKTYIINKGVKLVKGELDKKE